MKMSDKCKTKGEYGNTVYFEIQRDDVYLSWPIAPSYMIPNAVGRGELRSISKKVQLYTGAQIIFGDQTPYLTYALHESY